VGNEKAKMFLSANKHPECNGDEWGSLDMIDCYGRKHERILHYSGQREKEKLLKLANYFNAVSGYTCRWP